MLEGSGPIAADGETRGTVTILVRDAHGNPVAGARVGLETVEGDAALEQPATPTGPDGRVTGTVASEVAGAVQIRAVLYTGEGAQPLPKAVTVEFAAP